MNKLVLFDIDKTLIDGSRAHHFSYSAGFKKIYGIDADISTINHRGMTDQQIIIEVLKRNNLSEEEIKSKISDCMKVMIESFSELILKDEIIVLKGVRELLEILEKKGVLMGLVTGNLEPIARGKLKKINLDKYFKVGGFGSDHIDRTNLIKMAIKKAEDNFDFKFDNNVFHTGDATQDMMAGKNAGVKTIGVTTGPCSEEQLRAAGADFVFNNLSDTKTILDIILS